jgi:hypothetical protein
VNNAKFIITQPAEDSLWYVQQSPDIRFTKQRNEAKELSQKDALATMDILMTMQRTSSGPDAAAFSVLCVSKN